MNQSARALLTKAFTRRRVEAIILPIMLVVAFLDAELFVNLVALLLPVLASISIGVWLYLRRKAQLAKDLGLEITSFYEKVKDAGTLAFIAIDGAVLGVIVTLRAFGILGAQVPSRQFLLVGIAYALVLVAVPAIGWLQTWHTVWAPAIKRRENQPDQLEEQP